MARTYRIRSPRKRPANNWRSHGAAIPHVLIGVPFSSGEPWKVMPPVVLCLVLSSGIALGQGKKVASEAPGLDAVDLGRFAHPTTIDNKWVPMKPGTRWTYEGTSVEDDGKVVPHRIIVTITDLTKVDRRDSHTRFIRS